MDIGLCLNDPFIKGELRLSFFDAVVVLVCAKEGVTRVTGVVCFAVSDSDCLQ